MRVTVSVRLTHQDMPTPFCKEARLTYVHMHERVPRTFYFVVSSPGGVAETMFNVNFTHKHKVMSNSVDDDDEELSEPEEIHFPVFGSGAARLGWAPTVALRRNGFPDVIALLVVLPAVVLMRSALRGDGPGVLC